MKKLVALTLCALLCFALASSALAAEFQLRTSTNLAATSTVGKGLAKFAELVLLEFVNPMSTTMLLFLSVTYY